MPDHKIALQAGGTKYEGWESVRVTRSMGVVAGEFELRLYEQHSGAITDYRFGPGASCKILIDDQTVISGWIDDLNPDYSADHHEITVKGRDATADLADCSYIEDPQEWRNAPLLTIVTDICNPFSVGVTMAGVSPDKIEHFKINPGDLALSAIVKVCRMAKALPLSYGDGRLTLTTAGQRTCSDRLVLGDNILAGNGTQSNRGRFSQYLVKGQGQGSNKEGWGHKEPEDYVYTKAETTDPVIQRYRPYLILPGSQGSRKQYKDLAEFEASRRAGQSRRITYTVQGWTQQSGDLWPLNAEVYVRDSFMGLNEKLLIESLDYTVDGSNGTRTTIGLVHPDAYALEPVMANIKTPIDSGSFSKADTTSYGL